MTTKKPALQEIDYSQFSKRTLQEQCQSIKNDAKNGYDMDRLCRLYGIDYEHPAFTGWTNKRGKVKYYYEEGIHEYEKVAQDQWNEMVKNGMPDAVKTTLQSLRPERFSPRLAEQRAISNEGLRPTNVTYIINDRYEGQEGAQQPSDSINNKTTEVKNNAKEKED